MTKTRREARGLLQKKMTRKEVKKEKMKFKKTRNLLLKSWNSRRLSTPKRLFSGRD